MKLEKERQFSLKKGGGAQFTVSVISVGRLIALSSLQMTSADGTTLIISYDYVKDRDVNELAKTINYELSQEATPSPPSPSPANTDPAAAAVAVVSDRQFLEEFFSGRHCLTSGSGWWRFEICYGKHVIQFHVNNSDASVEQGSISHFLGRRKSTHSDYSGHMEPRQTYRMGC
jgi:endoplasmic reticulum lectin 1